jgi:hypothetical protein
MIGINTVRYCRLLYQVGYVDGGLNPNSFSKVFSHCETDEGKKVDVVVAWMGTNDR